MKLVVSETEHLGIINIVLSGQVKLYRSALEVLSANIPSRQPYKDTYCTMYITSMNTYVTSSPSVPIYVFLDLGGITLKSGLLLITTYSFSLIP